MKGSGEGAEGSVRFFGQALESGLLYPALFTNFWRHTSSLWGLSSGPHDPQPVTYFFIVVCPEEYCYIKVRHLTG